MTIASALTALNTDIQNARTAIANKGGTVTVDGGSSQLATDIGTITELKGETVTINPSTSSQTITPTSPKNGITSATVNPVTSSIDANITAENIKKDVVILGVTGTFEGGGGGQNIYRDIDSSGNLIIPTNANVTYTGLKTIGNRMLAFAFPAGSSPQNVSFPDLQTVGSYGLNGTFYASTGITNITFGKSLTLSDYSFDSFARDTTNLQTVTFNDITSTGTYAFNYAFYNSSVREIIINPKGGSTYSFNQNGCFAYMCENAKSLKKIVIGSDSNLSLMPSGAYMMCDGCSSLKFVRIGNRSNGDFKGIGVQSNTLSYCFRGCSSLKGLYIKGVGAGGRNIQYLCADCTNLIHASLPRMYPSNASQTSSYAFRDCPNLKQVDFGIVNITSSSYYGLFKMCFVGTTTGISLWGYDTTMYNPNTTAANAQFYGNTGLKALYLPKVTSFSGSGIANLFNNSGIQEFHFGKANKTSVESSANYSTLWGLGAGQATVYFDLINEITCGGTVYQGRCPGNEYYITGQQCFPYSITYNSTEYVRDTTSDTDVLICWKNGDTKIYTLTENPIATEPVYDATEEEIGSVDSSLIYYEWRSSSPYSYVYTTNQFLASVGENYYLKNVDGTFSVGGQITAVA